MQIASSRPISLYQSADIKLQKQPYEPPKDPLSTTKTTEESTEDIKTQDNNIPLPPDTALKAFFDRLRIEAKVREKQNEVESKLGMDAKNSYEPISATVGFIVDSYRQTLTEEARVQRANDEFKRQAAIKLFKESMAAITPNESNSSLSLVA